METKEAAHRRFVALTCAFYRESGWEDPVFERNASMARKNKTYCIDEGTQELACYVRRTLDVDIDALKAELATLAAQAHRWQRGEPVDEPWDAVVGGETGDLVAWTRLA